MIPVPVFFLKISFQKKIQKKNTNCAKRNFFLKVLNSFLKTKTAKRFSDFFWIFFEGDWKSRYYFLKVDFKMMFCLILKRKIKAKQRNKAEKDLKIFRRRLTAPKNIDLWSFPAKLFEIGNFFWRLVIFFWRRKPRSGFSILFWIFFWRPRSGNFFWRWPKSLKKHWTE